jgi:hypothetical protein
MKLSLFNSQEKRNINGAERRGATAEGAHIIESAGWSGEKKTKDSLFWGRQKIPMEDACFSLAIFLAPKENFWGIIREISEKY